MPGPCVTITHYRIKPKILIKGKMINECYPNKIRRSQEYQ